MMRALFSGVTGLSSHQTRMDVIGNNIANVNTVGFKKSSTTFSDLYSQTISPSSAPSGNLGGTNAKQVGLGASVASIVMHHTPGAAQYTGSPLDLAIEGDGYFCVRTPEGIRYTRAGNFNVSSTGSLVNSDGYFVQCYGADYKNGDSATAKSTGIDGRASTHFSEFSHVTTETPANGEPKSLIDASTKSGVYSFEAILDNTDNAYGSIKVYRNEMDTGEIVNAAVNGDTLTIDLSSIGLGKITCKVDAAGPPALDTTTKAYAEELASIVDFIKMEVSNNDGFVASNNSGDLTIDPNLYYNVSVDDQGAVVAQLKEDYFPPAGSNLPAMAKGEKITLGYVMLASFTNPAGLEKLGGNLYNASPNSGNAVYTQAGAQGVGTIAPSSLEMSNVDLASEMVDMIITQRGFQANSRIITTTDTMLEELVNLKR